MLDISSPVKLLDIRIGIVLAPLQLQEEAAGRGRNLLGRPGTATWLIEQTATRWCIDPSTDIMSRLYSGKAMMTHDSWPTRMLNDEDAEGRRWWAVELLQPKLKFGPRELISRGVADGVELVCYYYSEAIPDLEEKSCLRLGTKLPFADCVAVFSVPGRG